MAVLSCLPVAIELSGLCKELRLKLAALVECYPEASKEIAARNAKIVLRLTDSDIIVTIEEP